MCVLIDQISINLWLTEKLIILIQSYDDSYRGRKRKQSYKPFIYYRLASHSVYIARIKSNQTNQTYLPRSGIQYNQEFKRHRYKRSINYLFLCFITEAPLRRILTIFSLGRTVQYVQLRGIIWQETYWTKQQRKKFVWPAQSQNNSRKQQPDN